MQDKTSQIVSYIFHPLLFPFYTIITLITQKPYLYIDVPLSYTIFLLGTVLLTTIIFPLFINYFLFRKQVITSFFLKTKEERVDPILCIAIFYYLTYYLLKGVLVSGFFSYYMLGATLLAIFALLINFYHKVSLHLISIGAFTGFYLGMAITSGYNFLHYILLGIFLSGLIGYARLKSQSHIPSEIYSGFLVGFFTMIALVFLI